MKGQPAAGLISVLLPDTRGDGSNDGKNCAPLSVKGQETFETFDILQGLIAPARTGCTA